jgi:lipopolysaccharide/colanic/teichoic acid biosynthesis glycosyltransferase
MKRIFDVVSSLIGLLLIWPLLVVLGIWVKLDSAGPVFYRGVRAGKSGKPFRIFKLRTMVVNADQIGGAETPNDDPRITRSGNFLRHYKLDELPQLINVLKGDMSVVGPRPEVMDEVLRYNEEQQQLLHVQPGITDWASIKFRHEGEILRSSSDPNRTYHEKIQPEKIRLGLQYVRSRSLLVDLKIICRTLIVLFQ